MLKNLRNTALLGFWLLVLLWLHDRATAPPNDADARADANLKAEYDYYLTGMRTTNFVGTSATVSSQLEAQRVTHYPDGDRTVLEAPRLLSFQPEGNTWQVTAERGTLTADPAQGDERLDLQGQVDLQQPDNATAPRLLTEALTVFPAREEAYSEQPVTLHLRNMRMDGIGLQAWLATHRLKILEDVRSIYETIPARP